MIKMFPEPKFGMDQIIKAERIRYSADDPEEEYNGKITGMKFIVREEENEWEWEYQVEFNKPIYDSSWYLESDLCEGIEYKWDLARPLYYGSPVGEAVESGCFRIKD